ncbi:MULTISPECIES: hypothetical protein [unclassified Streptomyces]|uniref:DUF3885 domain-containing protein n=1 Tax=unclassified Streptomyces TaxID=2593676 RepID=UPI00225B269D|nr:MULTISPECIES: hypothetical protein [unclassified Streptomyces]MCX5331733.1 hypothetical protein [Streptomyces sp. NBC_00140]MCX5361134.1 hypothetical protein [Streptomyces sp. NBC_00124]
MTNTNTDAESLAELWRQRRPSGPPVAHTLRRSTELRCIHHPYDGGADVILATEAERDRLRDRRRDWLSSHPGGM